MKPRKGPGGFSLIELAVVVAVLALLGSGVLGTLSAQLESARIRATERELYRVQQALVGFAVANRNRLPCSDEDGDGQEDLDLVDGGCRAGLGVLPWRTLGAGRADGWGRAFLYHPDRAYASVGGVPNPPDSADRLTVVDALDGTTLTLGDPHAPAAVVLSCGRNGVPDGDNADAGGRGCQPRRTGDRIYAQAIPGAAFDDMSWWLSKNVLLGALVRAGTWP